MTIRPQGARVVAYGVAAIMVVLTAVIGLALPDEIIFTVPEQITLALLLVFAIGLLHGVGRSFVRADDEGVEVQNGYRRHHLTWAQVEGISMREGAPWPTLVTTADERIMLFAIQRTDGPRSRDAVQKLREWVA